MPTWLRSVADGGSYTGGFVRVTSPLGNRPSAAVYNTWAYEFVTSGSVDLNGDTRFQYDILDFTLFYARVRFNFTAADVVTAAGKNMTGSYFLAPASAFGTGVIPTISQIIAASVLVGRGTTARTTAGDLDANVVPAASASWDPNVKYWIAAIPTMVTSMVSTPSVANDVPLIPVGQTVNTLGRALSVWTNRTPDKPRIVTPLAQTTAFAGTEITLTFDPNDPDSISSFPGDDRPTDFDDVAGVQIQYAPNPTTDNPTPAWADLPITNTDGTGTGRGWYIDRSATAPANDGAKAFRDTYTMKIRCGSTTLTPGTGNLASGDWQVRVRTFDYGHPIPYVASPPYIFPLTQSDGLYTPDTYPAVNTSPWSDPVRIFVSEQIPKPVPLYPTNNIAIAAGLPITLSWQYRNTYSPPFPQAERTVQIRKVGESLWTTLVSGESEESTFTIVPPFVWTDDATSLTNWQSFLDTSGMSIVDGRIRISADALFGAGLLILERSSIGIPDTLVEVTIKGRRLGSEDSVEPNPSAIFASFTLDGIVSDQTLSSGTNIDNADYPTLTDWELVYSLASTFDTVTIPFYFDGSDAATLEVGSIEVRGGFALEESTQYEWRVQTTDTDGVVSVYSDIARFWVVPAPQSGDIRPIPSDTIDGATLGCGVHTVEIYRRGGLERVGVLDQVSHVDWGRLRDDISTSQVIVSGWDIDCGNLLSELQTWAYEVVIWRNNGYSNDRVWEGPITLLTYETNRVVIESKDVMGYAYRRIIKQEMSDTKNGSTVTTRAMQVLFNAFAPDDPNVLAYMNVLSSPDDAMQYRSTPAYSRTAFEEVDDMAANAGLDYTTIGRAILLWSTKHKIGTLPEFSDDDLGSPPIVSEYGMSMANRYVVSDGNGVWGEATRGLDVSGNDPIYGLVEMLSSTWASDTENETGTYTQEGVNTIIESFEGFAERSIADRYPPPVIVRVPDNTTLNPSTALSIQQLVPGVAIPLRSTGTLRNVVAMQKLDSIKVVEESGKETISITLSPFAAADVEEGEG